MRSIKRYAGLVVAVTLIATLTSIFLLPSAKAAGGNFHVFSGASSTSVANGSNVSIPVYINTGGNPVDAVDMVFTYDSTKLEFQSATASGSPFDQNPIYNNSGGTINGGAYKTSTVNGDYLIFTATFKAKVGSGSTTVQVTSGSAAYAGGNSIGAALATGTVSFTTPTCAAGQTGTYPNCVSPTPTPSPTCSSDQTGTYPNCVAKTCPSGYTGTYPNCTAPAGTTKCAAGYTGKPPDCKAIASTDSKPDKTPSTTTPKTTDSQPSSTTTPKANVIPKLVIGVYDKNHNPLKRKKVTLHSDPQTVETDDNGNATFTDVPVGDHTLTYTQDGKDYSQTVTFSQALADVDLPTTSNATAVVFQLEQSSNRGLIVTSVISAVLLLAAIVGVIIFRRWYPNRQSKLGHHLEASSAVVMPAESQDETTALLNAIPNRNTPQPGQTYEPKSTNTHEE